MKLLRYILLTLTCTMSVVQARAAEPNLKNFLSQPWDTLRIGIYHFGGDYIRDRPLLILHRAKDGALLLVYDAPDEMTEHRLSTADLQAAAKRLL